MFQQPSNSKRDGEATGTGRQIPIEDANGVKPEEDGMTQEASAQDAVTSPDGAAGSVDDSASAADAAAAADEATQDPKACVSESQEDASADAYDDSDVVREAEAVLEQAEAESSADELVAAAQAEAKEWQDKFMRLHAEWDTYRRRMGEQREVEKALATEKLVSSLIPVIDDFERTIDFASSNGEAELLDGVKAVHAKFVDVLVKAGVVVINPAGEPYDALEAQAVATVPNEDVPDETVADVYQKGYKMGSKVLRPAMVTVTAGGPAREKSEGTKED